MKQINGNIPKWISIIALIVGMIFTSGGWWAQYRIYAATVCEQQTAIKILSDKMDGIDRRLYRIEIKLDMEDAK